MKIAGVISSPHENGNTATLVREALAGAEEGGASTSFFGGKYMAGIATAGGRNAKGD